VNFDHKIAVQSLSWHNYVTLTGSTGNKSTVSNGKQADMLKNLSPPDEFNKLYVCMYVHCTYPCTTLNLFICTQGSLFSGQICTTRSLGRSNPHIYVLNCARYQVCCSVTALAPAI